MTLAADDLRWLTDLSWRLHGARSSAQVFAEALQAVHGKFRGVGSQADEALLDYTAFQSHGVLSEVAVPSDYFPLVQDSPIVVAVPQRRQSEVLHMRDLVTPAEYQRTVYYNELARPLGVEEQIMGLVIFDGVKGCGLGVNRAERFTDGELSLFGLVHRQFEAALRRMRQNERDDALAGLPESGWVQLDEGLQPSPAPAWLRGVLEKYLPGPSVPGGEWRLPGEISDWLRAVARESPLGLPPEHVIVGRQGAKLALRFFPNAAGAGAAMKLVEYRPAATQPLARLTEREREVLHWLVQGKRDAEIALILCLSPKTVSKHVEHILQKLDVESRTAAARLAVN